MKITKYTLDNGLKLIFCNDNTKHCTIANLFVNFGGSNQKIIIDNEDIKIKNGMAHFMEHLLIEHSIYGNALNEFKKNHTFSNGMTDDLKTEYYINSVINFEDDLVKLINIVNNSKFTKENVEVTRGAIIKEKMMTKDNEFTELYKIGYECLFNNLKYPNVLGEINDIETISYDELKLCYDTFYSPNNQTLVVSGKFNEKKVKKLIEDTYNEINKKTISYKLPEIKESNEVKIKEKTIKKDIYIDYVRLNYKLDITHFTNIEQLKLGFYLDNFLSNLFDGSSKLYSELVEQQICMYNIDYSFEKIDNYYIVKIGTYTDKHDEFINKVVEAISKKELNKKDFEIRKSENIIDLILREDSLFSMIKPFFDNIFTFNYYELDKIEDVENQTFEDYKETLDKISFNQYCITKMIKSTNN